MKMEKNNDNKQIVKQKVKVNSSIITKNNKIFKPKSYKDEHNSISYDFALSNEDFDNRMSYFNKLSIEKQRFYKRQIKNGSSSKRKELAFIIHNDLNNNKYNKIQKNNIIKTYDDKNNLNLKYSDKNTYYFIKLKNKTHSDIAIKWMNDNGFIFDENQKFDFFIKSNKYFYITHLLLNAEAKKYLPRKIVFKNNFYKFIEQRNETIKFFNKKNKTSFPQLSYQEITEDFYGDLEVMKKIIENMDMRV